MTGESVIEALPLVTSTVAGALLAVVVIGTDQAPFSAVVVFFTKTDPSLLMVTVTASPPSALPQICVLVGNTMFEAKIGGNLNDARGGGGGETAAAAATAAAAVARIRTKGSIVRVQQKLCFF
jgi:hypothetical protein